MNGLKKRLEARDQCSLYQDSITCTIEDENEDLKRQLDIERNRRMRAERENRELDDFLDAHRYIHF